LSSADLVSGSEEPSLAIAELDYAWRSSIWWLSSSTLHSGTRFHGPRARSNCELAPVGEIASRICSVSAQSHVDAVMAVGTAHI
jgi:hypothetical protein